MSGEQQTAILQEVLDQSHQFRENCALKHGLQAPLRNIIPPPKPPMQPIPVAPPLPAPLPVITPPAGGGVAGPSAALRTAKAAALTLAAATGIGGGVAMVSSWLDAIATPDPHVISVPDKSDETEPSGEVDGDLLKFLREQGYHLPPAGGKDDE